jgi:predicted ATPase/class 3 adenylate cyclase
VTLESFVPEFVLHRLAATGSTEEPTEELIPAVALMADVVGYTAMTEAMMESSSSGSEELSARLLDTFGALDQIVAASGGSIVDFMGDALLAVWRVGTDGDMSAAAGAAVSCANAIQARGAALETDTDGLAFRVAVGAGRAWLVSAGGHDGSWIPIVAGDAIEQLDPALKGAQPGEVVLSPEAAELLGVEGRRAPSDIQLDAGDAAAAVSAPERVDAALLHPFVPEIVKARHEAGLLESFAEYRRISVVFIRLPRVDPDDPDRVAKIQELTLAFQEAVATYGGSVVNVLADHRGTTAIAVWGAALHVHDDDALRAIRAVRALCYRLGELGVRGADRIPAAVGSGPVFFGDIGGSRSRQHAVVGDAINRAARLLDQSDGKILSDAETAQAARRRIAFEELAPRTLKGVSGETRVFAPTAELAPELPGRQPIVGRSDEVAQLIFELETVTRGESRGRLLVIEGEAGIGKSRLVSHLLERSQQLPIRGIVIQGTPFTQSTPYHSLRPALLDLLGGEHAASESLEEMLPGSPQRQELVKRILGLTAEAQQLAPSNPDAAHDALAAVLTLLFERTPTLLVVEDAQWLDEPSWELLGSLVNIPGILLVLSIRLEPGSDQLYNEYLADAAHTTVLQLGPLDRNQTAALVSQRLDVSSLPEDLGTAIFERTEGHPLFTEELALAMRDAGIIRVDAQGHVEGTIDELTSLAYPTTVQSTVASRIDQLSLPQQQSLRVASVVGRDFNVATVAAAHPGGLTEDDIAKHLSDIERHYLLERGAADGAYRFKNALIADVAYTTLPEAERRRIHERVAVWLRGQTGELPSLVDPTIAQHWIRAGNAEEAEASLERSAEYAMGIAAYQEAINFLSQAQELGRGTASRLQQARWATSLGAAYRALGDLPASQRALEGAVALLGNPMPRARARLWMGLAGQSLRQLAHRIAPRLFLSRRRDRQEQIHQLATAYFAMTTTTFASQDAPALFYVGLQATNQAERIPPSAVLARGYSFLAYGSGTAGLEGLADRYHERGLVAAETAGNRQALADVEFNRAVYLTSMGSWDGAGAATDRAMDEFGELNLHYDYLNAFAMRIFQLLHQGQWDAAAARYRELGEEAADLEERLHIVWSRVWGAAIVLRQGDPGTAITQLSDSADLAATVAEFPSQIALLGFLALGEWREGRQEEALGHAANSLDLMKRTEWLTAPHAYDGFAATTRVLLAAWERSLTAPGERSPQSLQRSAQRACRSMSRLARSVPIARPREKQAWGLYYALAGKQRRAMRSWKQGLAESERLGMPYEEARILTAMLLHGELTDEQPAAYRERAAAIYASLGALPDLASIGATP